MTRPAVTDSRLPGPIPVAVPYEGGRDGERPLTHGQLNIPRWLDELVGLLRAHLPAALIPGTFVRLDALPRTLSGKVDQERLPLPAARETTR